MLIRRWQALLLGLIVVLSSLVFLPGSSGPLIFDDYSNLVENTYVKINNLEFDTLRRAAYSLDAGPLQRPIPMLSFALNYYWTGSLTHTTPYKLTNIAIHGLNGLLVFWLMYLVLIREAKLDRRSSDQSSSDVVLLLAAAAAVLWVVHPIQASATLYIIQRMAGLSAMFTLLAMVSYIIAREGLSHGKRWAPSVLIAGPLVFGALGMLSKENTILLPLFVAVFEYCFYSSEWPWSRWSVLSPQVRRCIIVGVAAAAVVLTIVVVYYALPPYGYRQFTMYERVLTESRVLLFYLALIFVPRLDQFGHQHDDIPISASLFTPWTTLPSIAIHLAILACAVMLHERHRLITFGILWFYVAHLLESTVFALEIAHEHRNYLALFGPVCVIIGLIEVLRAKLEWKRARWILFVIGMIFAATAAARADQWRDYNSFYRYEAIHHPKSPRIQIGLSILLEGQGRRVEALEAIRRAIDLDPKEVGYYLQLYLVGSRIGVLPTPAEQERTIELLREVPISATTFLALQHAAACIQTSCKSLQVPLETWARTVLDRIKSQRVDKSYYNYLLGLACAAQGKTDEAIKYLWIASEEDRAFLHPLFALASIYVQHRNLEGAERVLSRLQYANSRVDHPRDAELALVERDVNSLRAAHHKAPIGPVAR